VYLILLKLNPSFKIKSTRAFVDAQVGATSSALAIVYYRFI